MKIEMFRYLTLDNDTEIMAKESDILRIVETFEIFFPNCPKDTKTKTGIYKKLLELISGSEEFKDIKLDSKDRNRRITLDSDEFDVTVDYLKRFAVRIRLVDPYKNLKDVNEIVNNIMNFVNSITGSSARESKVVSTRIVCKKNVPNLKGVIGEKCLAKINDRAGLPLNPFGIIFEYEKEDRRFVLGVYYDRPAQTISGYKDYKEPIPRDFIIKEDESLKEPEKTIKKLYQTGL
jgi:hypothetical protein